METNFTDYDLGFGRAMEFCREMMKKGKLREAFKTPPHSAPASVEDIDAWKEGWKEAMEDVRSQESDRSAETYGEDYRR